MRTVLCVLLVMYLCAANDSVTEQLRMKLPQSEYNAELVDMLELSLKGGKIDEVIEMLQKMVNDLEGIQNAANMEYSKRLSQFNQNIEDLEKTLEKLNQDVQLNNNAMSETATQIASLTTTLTSVKTQLASINEREEAIRNARTEELHQQELRKSGSEKVLQALKTIHTRLSQTLLSNSGSFLEVAEKTTLLETLKRELGERNPISLMVELTTQFDEATARRVIDKLEEIIQSIEGAVESDDKNKVQASSTFDAMLNEISGLREKLGQEQQKSSSSLKNKNNDLTTYQRRGKELDKDLKNTEILLQTNRLQKGLIDSNHQSSSSKRDSELGTLKMALQVLMDNAEKLRK